MARVKNLDQPVAAPVADTRTQLAQGLRSGKVVPIIGNVLTYNLLLGGYDDLVALYLKGYLPKYPAHDDLDLAHLTQYYHITRPAANLLKPSIRESKLEFLNFAKSLYFNRVEAKTSLSEQFIATIDEEFDDLSLSKLLERVGYALIPTEMANPWRILAEFRLPIYLTTCSHDLLEVALREAGVKPRTQICPLTKLINVKSVFEGGYEPSADEPLVYHLHGRDDYPESLVLTESDHLEFLTTITADKGKDTDVIPPKVREVLNTSALMLLGYNLRQWEFTSLFWGLIKSRTHPFDYLSNSVVYIQVEPSELERQYVQEYLRSYKFEVTWGDATEHLQELYQLSKE